MPNNIPQHDFNRCDTLLNYLRKAVTNSKKRIAVLETMTIDSELIEVIQESVIQTHEIAIELAWKTVRCFALRVEPAGKVSGSTTAIKLGLSTGVINDEALARILLEAIQHRNLSSHEYLLVEGLEGYVHKICKEFHPAIQRLLADLEGL